MWDHSRQAEFAFRVFQQKAPCRKPPENDPADVIFTGK